MSDVKNISIKSEKDVTAADILREGDEIWAKCREFIGMKKGFQIDDQIIKRLDGFLEQMQKEHKDFAGAYPTVLRHMIQELQYNHKVFERYLSLLEKKSWTNDSERMDSYTDYAVLLYREQARQNRKQHVNATEIAAFRRDYRRRLQEEHDGFIDMVKKYKEEVDREEEKMSAEVRVELTSAFKRLAQQSEIPEDKVEQVLKAISAGTLSTVALQQLVYNMRRSQSGVSYDTIVQERDETQRKVAEKLANTMMPNSTQKSTAAENDVIENIKKMRLQQVQDEVKRGE